MASVFVMPLIVRIHGNPLTTVACSYQPIIHIPYSQQCSSKPCFKINGPFPYFIFEIYLETSCQFVASAFGTPPVVRIHGNLYLFIVVTST